MDDEKALKDEEREARDAGVTLKQWRYLGGGGMDEGLTPHQWGFVSSGIFRAKLLLETLVCYMDNGDEEFKLGKISELVEMATENLNRSRELPRAFTPKPPFQYQDLGGEPQGGA